jgi:parallel beta-helix repeat protein
MTSAFQNDTKIEQVSIQANVTDPSTGQLVYSGSSIISVGSCSQSGIGCVAPPTGDWVITTDVLCINVTVPVTGRLIIQPGASLTLRGATVNFSFDHPGALWHYNGIYNYGTFNMIEDWNGNPSRLTVNFTESDCATLLCDMGPPSHSLGPCCGSGQPRFVFNSYKGANLTLNNSIIDHVGSFSFGTCGGNGDVGVYTIGDNAIIQNMDISNCRDACILVEGSGTQILNNKIHRALGVRGVGIEVGSGGCAVNDSIPATNAYISGNEIYGFSGGIWVDDWVANNLITGNYIHDSGTGISVHDGDAYTGTKNNNRIQSNTITNNSYGVVVFDQRYAQLSSNIIQNNTISGVSCTLDSSVSDFSGDIISKNPDNCDTCRVLNGHGTNCPVAVTILNCADTPISGYTKLTNHYQFSGGSACFVINQSNTVLDCDGYRIMSAGGTGIGINVSGPGGSPVYNTTIKNCAISNFNAGISVLYGINSVIEGNSLSFNTRVGVEVVGPTSPTTLNTNITRNTIKNSTDGISIQKSKYDTIGPYNVLFNNTNGINIYWAQNENITGNNASGNSRYGAVINYVVGFNLSNNTLNYNGLAGADFITMPNLPMGCNVTSNQITHNGVLGGIRCSNTMNVKFDPGTFSPTNSIMNNWGDSDSDNCNQCLNTGELCSWFHHP